MKVPVRLSSLGSYTMVMLSGAIVTGKVTRKAVRAASLTSSTLFPFNPYIMLVPAKVCPKPVREMFMVLLEVKTTVRSSITLCRLPRKVPDIPGALTVTGLGVVGGAGTVAGATVLESTGAAVGSPGAALVPTSAEHSTGISSGQVGSLGWKQVTVLVGSV